MPYDAQTICQYARWIAKCPGFTAFSGGELNRVLEEAAQNYDLPASRVNLTNFTISPNGGGGQNTQFYELTGIPAGATYLRTKDVFYSVDGTIFYLAQISLFDYDKLFQGAGISNYPYWYTVDDSQDPPQMAFYPPPNLSLSLTIRVQTKPPDITTPETSTDIPWFPNQTYLQQKLAARLMRFTGDTRVDKFDMDADEQLKKYLRMAGDTENFAQTVKLDRTRFRSTADLKPTKTTGF